MRRRKKIKTSNNSGSIADIAFLLLIFFMVTTSFERENYIPMNLPPLYDGPSSKVDKNRIVTIALNGNNQILIEGEETGFPNLSQSITNTLNEAIVKSNHPIIKLNLHHEANYEAYMTLISAIKNAIKITKESKIQEMFNTVLEKITPEQLDKFNAAISFKISETEVKY